MNSVVILPKDSELEQWTKAEDSDANENHDAYEDHDAYDLYRKETSTLHATHTVLIDTEDHLTPYEAALQIVARNDVHIARVWPMRSPSTAPLEDSSSANFQTGHTGIPPAGITPVGGLRMTQAFAHEPVMAGEVVDLFAPVPPGLVVDATLGGAGHAAALLDAYPEMELLGIDRDPRAIEAAISGTGLLRGTGDASFGPASTASALS